MLCYNMSVKGCTKVCVTLISTVLHHVAKHEKVLNCVSQFYSVL